jgi:hypothetical protein
VRERMERMRTEKVDLLQASLPLLFNCYLHSLADGQFQFHWQDYANLDYIRVIEILSDLKTEGLIAAIGLCNFDALHTDEICARFPGTVVSNQIPVRITRRSYAAAMLKLISALICPRPVLGGGYASSVCDGRRVRQARLEVADLWNTRLRPSPEPLFIQLTYCFSVAASSRTSGSVRSSRIHTLAHSIHRNARHAPLFNLPTVH